MKEYVKNPGKTSRTLDNHPQPSRQAPLSAILQTYQKGILRDRSLPRENTQTDSSKKEIELTLNDSETKSNNAGLPTKLKEGIENLSGYHMNDVQVHYNSDKPAQLQAFAYTRGTDIYIAPGHEKHLSHEAWHVAQQKQGRVQTTRQWNGINMNDNEELEKEAEIMGEAAIRSQPRHTKELKNTFLSVQTSQLFGGDIDRAKVLPRFGGVNPTTSRLYTVQELLTIKDRAKGRPGQESPVKRDANHNNIDKVRFENDLALMILHSPDSYIEKPIRFLTEAINSYIEKKLELQLITSRNDELEKFLSPEMKTKYPTIFGRLTDLWDISYTQYLDQLLIEGGDLYSQLQMQATFISEIYSKDFEADFFHDVRFMQLVKSLENPTLYKDKKTWISDGSIYPPIPFEEGHGDARIKPGITDSVYGKGGRDKHVPQSSAYYGITARELTKAPTKNSDPEFADIESLSSSPAPFQRGMDYWTANEESAFIQDARLNLDMPITGTGASGTTAELLTCAKIFGLPDGDLKRTYVIALLGYFIISGAHSFHEIMSVASNAGILYIPGDYFRTLEALAENTPFKKHFNDLMIKYRNLEKPEPPLASTIPSPLRDEIFDGISSPEWNTQIGIFLTVAFDSPCEEIHMLGGGRSAAPVYKVKLKGEFYVLKIFPDVREAETEIKMLLLLREKGIKSVMPQIAKDGNTVFPVGGKNSRKAGILMDLARGPSVDELIENLQPEQETEEDPDFETLTHAVRGTALLLSKLHKRPEGRKKTFMEQQRIEFDIQFTQQRIKKIVQDPQKNALIGELLQKTYPVISDMYRNAKLEASIIHSDANTGNFIWEGKDISVIDVATMEQSLDRNSAGLKTGSADAGRFLQSLLTSHPGKISRERFIFLCNEFYEVYNQQSGLPQGSKAQTDFQKGSLFHRYALEILTLLLATSPDTGTGMEIIEKSRTRILEIINEAETLGVQFNEKVL